MFFAKFFCLATVAIVLLSQIDSIMAGDKHEDTIILGGDHGCGPKLLYKSGGKKKGDILLMNGDCKKKKQTHYIPYPVYHSYGGYGDSGYGGHDSGYGGGYGGHY